MLEPEVLDKIEGGDEAKAEEAVGGAMEVDTALVGRAVAAVVARVARVVWV